MLSLKEINERLLKLLKDIYKESKNAEVVDELTDITKDEIKKLCQENYDENFITLYGLYNHILGEDIFKIMIQALNSQYGSKKIIEKVEEHMKLTIYASETCDDECLNTFFNCIDNIIEDNEQLIKKHIRSVPLDINFNHLAKVHDYIKTTEYIDFHEFIDFMFGVHFDELIECRLIRYYGVNENNKLYIKKIKEIFDNYLK